MPTPGLPNARAEASRRNGAKSRGPKTTEGKSRSSRNALKHGLRAEKHMVLPDEDAAEFEALEAALIDELAPDGVLQTLLVKRIAASAWRMGRAERIEVEIFAENALPDGGPGLSMIRDANRARAFETLVRYRGGTMAEFWRSLRTLKALQAEAAGRAEVTAPPAQAQVAGPQPDQVAPPPRRPNEPKTPGIPGDVAGPTVPVAPDFGAQIPPNFGATTSAVSSGLARSGPLLAGTALVAPETLRASQEVTAAGDGSPAIKAATAAQNQTESGHLSSSMPARS